MLVGEEHRGLEYMFIMMNAARFAVGIQGISVAERACQKAVAYARERVQSRDLAGSAAGAVTIIHQPDVRRMLMSMRAQVEAAMSLRPACKCMAAWVSSKKPASRSIIAMRAF